MTAIRAAVAALREGRPVLVADDEARENEVDVILSAALASPEWIAWTVRHTSGYLCAPMPAARADELGLPPMVGENEDPRRTAYAITADAASGITTGISASDRAVTLRTLASPTAVRGDLIRPGHIVPLRAVTGGVLERAGHTEAAIDLMHIADLEPVGVIAELVRDDGAMMRRDDALALGASAGVPFLTIADIRDHLLSHPARDVRAVVRNAEGVRS